MWRKNTANSKINAYVSEFQIGEDFCDTEIESAIQNLDFERAKVINDAKTATVFEDAKLQEEHYKKEEEALKQRNMDEMKAMIAKNQKEFERQVKLENEKHEQEFYETEKRQKIEIKHLIRDWREARAEELIKINKQIDDLILEAQDLARNKAFDDAIAKRDYAFALRKQRSYPQMKPIDEIYQAQMDKINARHKKEFKDLEEYHKLRIQELEEELNAKNLYAESQMAVDQACVPELIMSTIINNSTNFDATVAVMSSVSPTKAQPKTKRQLSKSKTTPSISIITPTTFKLD